MDRNNQNKTERDKYEEMFISKSVLSAEIGIGIPFKEFGLKDLNNDRSGYAINGFSYSFSFRYAFYPSLGMTLKYFNTTNAIDVQRLQSDLNQAYSPYSVIYSADPYILNGFMIGPTYITSSSNWSLETSICAGYLYGVLPQNSLHYTPPVPVYQWKFTDETTSSSSAINYGMSLDLAVKYKLSQSFVLSASADVMICDLTFRNISKTFTDTAGNVYSGNLDSYLQPFRLIHLRAGIGYQFR
ncbi:MAG: hypothetical protein ACHQK8_03940 [Bacteroidia bacterium]